MASSKFARDRGFEEERFELPVSENFKCSICLNVLNNPKSCRNNQHYFCSGCIGEHLKNSHTCPECMEELAPETLVQPPRVLLNCILELRIKCVYSQRGCPEHVQLGRLQNHADECRFAPAQCENEGCGAEVNKGEKARHETDVCKFRKVECYGCGELKKEIQELRKSDEEAIKNMEKTLRKEIIEKENDMNRKMAEVLENQKRMTECVEEAFKESLSKIKAIFKEGQSDRQATQNPQASKPHVAQSPQHIGFRIYHDILVMGGWGKDDKPTNSVEKFCFKERRWIDVAPMVVPRHSASSVVFENKIIVSGGKIRNPSTDRDEAIDSIEILNLDQFPLKWVMFAGKLFAPMIRHQTFVYKGKLIVVGKYCKTEKDGRGRKVSNDHHTIYEVLLSPPYSATQLYSLSRISDKFIAQLVNNKLFIFGGSNSDVKTYDLDVYECREMPNLPYSYPWNGMATVQWREYVILLGGKYSVYDEDLIKKIGIIQYNTTTGESTILACTNNERVGCTAVTTDDVIIAMGGLANVNSAECYNFHTNTWHALPVMRERRYLATAVFFPI